MPRIHQEVADITGVVADGGRQPGDVPVVGDADDQRIGVVHRGHVPLSSSPAGPPLVLTLGVDARHVQGQAAASAVSSTQRSRLSP